MGRVRFSLRVSTQEKGQSEAPRSIEVRALGAGSTWLCLQEGLIHGLMAHSTVRAQTATLLPHDTEGQGFYHSAMKAPAAPRASQNITHKQSYTAELKGKEHSYF